MTIDDHNFMKLALDLARRGLGVCGPNPSVGALLTQKNRDENAYIIARAWTARGGVPHAEPLVIKCAGEQAGALAKGAELYVTLEPCAHYGRSPPCVEAIIEAGISRVIYALKDPDERVAGLGLRRLSEAGIEISPTTPDLKQEALWITLGHILRVTRERPFVQLKLAVSADGLVAAGESGAPHWVTGELARAHGHLMRSKADAILIGRGTAQADNPELTCRLPGLGDLSPIRIVLDSRLEISVASNLVQSAGVVPLWLLCSETAPTEKKVKLRDAGVDLIELSPPPPGDGLNLAEALQKIASRGITRLMIEGGPRIAGSFISANLVDEIVIFQGGKALGPEGLMALGQKGLDVISKSGQFKLVRERLFGADKMRLYRRPIGYNEMKDICSQD